MGQSDSRGPSGSLDKTPRVEGRQHRSEPVGDDQNMYRHRIPTYQDDAAIVSLCRNKQYDIRHRHSEQDNSSEQNLSSTPFANLDSVHGVFGVGHSSSIRMFSSATKHGSFTVSTHFPTRPGRHVVETRRMGIGVMQKRLLLVKMIRSHPRVHYKCLASPSVHCQYAEPNLNSHTRGPIGYRLYTT